MEARHGDERRAVAGELERGLAAHAEADRGNRQALAFWQAGDGSQPGLESAAVSQRIGTDRGGECAGLVEAGRAQAVEVGDEREVAGLGERLRLGFDRRRGVHDGWEHKDGRPRRSRWTCEQACQPGIAVGVMMLIE